MTAEKYVNAIVKNIQCGLSRKKEIKKELLSDIRMQTEQGRELGEIMEQMGSIQEIANSFNENMPQEEIRQFKRNRVVKAAAIVVVLLAVIAGGIYWYLPKTTTLEKSRYFTEEQVLQAMQETITWIDDKEYAALQEHAIDKMKAYFTEEEFESIKKQIYDGWGERQGFAVYGVMELSQMGTHYAVGEIQVIYENVSVIYRLTYDKDMKLAGLYIR